MVHLVLSDEEAACLNLLLEQSTINNPASEKVLIRVSLESSITPRAVHALLHRISDNLALVS